MKTSYLREDDESFGFRSNFYPPPKWMSHDQQYSTNQQTSNLAQLHIINASTFYMFQANAFELRRTLEKLSQGTHYSTISGNHPSILYGIRRTSQFVCERLSEYRRLSQQSEKLIASSYAVTPIYLRHGSIEYETKVVALCDCKVLDIRIAADEPLTLLDSRDPLLWTVRKGNNVTTSIPSVACLIPGPDQKSVELAYFLQAFLLENWKRDLIFIQKIILKLFEKICNGVSDDEIDVHPRCSDDFRMLLTSTLNDIFIGDHSGINGDIHDSDETSEFLKVHSKCCDCLENTDSIRKNSRYGVKESIDANTIFDIRLIISTFTELVKGCRRLIKHARLSSAEKGQDGSTRSTNQTDVEKLFNRLSIASNDSSVSFLSDGMDDVFAGTYRSKCISRLYLSLSNTRDISLEKFVNTTEIINRMPITVIDGSNFSTSKSVKLEQNDHSGETSINYCVRYFEIQPFSLDRSVKSTQYSIEDTTITTDPDILPEFPFETNVIERVRTEALRSGAPPTAANSDSYTKTSIPPGLNSSWTQTALPSELGESYQLIDCLSYSYNADAGTGGKRNGDHNTPLGHSSIRFLDKLVQTEVAMTVKNSQMQTDVSREKFAQMSTQTSERYLTEAFAGSDSAQSGFDSEHNGKYIQTERLSQMDESVGTDDRAGHLANVGVQVFMANIVDDYQEHAIGRLTQGSQTTITGSSSKRHRSTQTGNLSYEVITRVLIEGDRAKDTEVLSVVWKSDDVDF